ncbi:DUF6221 family protein [Streptomyces sp. NPDC055966]|uniref:DUF6221 family protein n=1 Tax=Streptomyces sp. NPDC055966 TaxID=3345669 RepID=UPI0035DADED3
MTDTDQMVTWLRAAMDEAERISKAAATPGPWTAHKYTWGDDFEASIGTYDETNVVGHGYEGGGVVWWTDAVFIAANNPAAVLRRIAVDRQLLDDLLTEQHNVVEDPAYTCPAATAERDGGRNYHPGACNCGRDERVQRRVRLFAEGYGWTEEMTSSGH